MANTSQDLETFTKSLAGLTFSNADSPGHSSLYKQKQSKSSLDDRRATFLEDQKRRRFDYMNLVRDLTETDFYEGDVMEYDPYYSGYYPSRHYFHRDQLMLSEWMTEVPHDFEDEWLCVPCPVGKRCIVVASRGKTSSWTKASAHIDTFKSNFPGGNHVNSRDSTILDCIHSKSLNTYFILDLMSWKGQPIYDSETEFRFYWLHTQLQEHPEIYRKSKLNTAHFVPLTSHACSRESIYNALEHPAFKVEIDGVLFYHRRAHYTLGATPLVGWLKPFMLPEIIDMDLPQRAKSTRPANYVDYKTYIEKFNEKYTKRSPGGMFKKSGQLTGNKGGPPIERKPFVPREIVPRNQKKSKQSKKKENKENEAIGVKTSSTPQEQLNASLLGKRAASDSDVITEDDLTAFKAELEGDMETVIEIIDSEMDEEAAGSQVVSDVVNTVLDDQDK